MKMTQNMETPMKLAIETYSELSGMAIDDVKAECLKDTPVRKSVTMLMFTSATMHKELRGACNGK